jgi:hypothetical protein
MAGIHGMSPDAKGVGVKARFPKRIVAPLRFGDSFLDNSFLVSKQF